jgi:ABC-type glutathione transport system ATPase component
METDAPDDISVDVKPGEFLAIIGQSVVDQRFSMSSD